VPHADGLADGQLRAIAREFNQSETTFIQSPTRDGATRRLRSFTPTGQEVYGAGHNALGAWLWLAIAGGLGPGSYVQQIGEELLPVHVRHDDGGRVVVTMEQTAAVFGAAVTDHAELAAALGLAVEDLGRDRPARVVDTGAGHLLVPVRDRGAVDRVRPLADRLVAVLAGVGGEGCYVYSLDGPAAAYARFFNPAMGIAEDPATGTAAGPLAAELLSEGTLVVEQGHALGRPSTLTVTVDGGGGVRLSGSGLVVARGTIDLPAAAR
jgi:PhzF family phenazine biosynthesis protein